MPQVCDKLADIMPKRVAITPLLPAPSAYAPALLMLSQSSVRAQLRAHLAALMAKSFLQLRLAHGCSAAGDPGLRVEEVVRAMLSGPEAQGCIKVGGW